MHSAVQKISYNLETRLKRLFCAVVAAQCGLTETLLKGSPHNKSLSLGYLSIKKRDSLKTNF